MKGDSDMNKLIRSLTVAGITLGAGVLTASASSHREAPAIAEDQYVDNTDVYAFISPNDANRLVIVANYVPLLLPASGPNFYKFSDNARYEVHIDNNGDAVPDIAYRWTFTSHRKNGATFLYNTGAIESLASQNLNVTQTYKLEKVDEKTGATRTIMEDVPVTPWNVGKNSFPNGTYEQVALQAVTTANGTTAFAGPRDEPFFVDLHVFDLLGVGGAHTTDGVKSCRSCSSCRSPRSPRAAFARLPGRPPRTRSSASTPRRAARASACSAAIAARTTTATTSRSRASAGR
jgi:hypothetical protein